MLTAKEFLTQAYRIDQRINNKLDQICSLRELATKATATLNDSGYNATKNVHSMDETIANIVDLENEINQDIDNLVETKRNIMLSIKCVEDLKLQMLLELRYLCFKTSEQIAVDMDCTRRHVDRMHDTALKSIKF